MQEIEVKILDIDKDAIISKLVAMGATKAFDDEITAIFFDREGRPLQESKQLLRLRKEGETSVLTYKKKLQMDESISIRNETEVVVSDFDKTKEILESLGFIVADALTKHRTSYHLQDAHIDIDEVPGIPTFLEIEVPDSTRMEHFVTMLGYSMTDTKPWGFNTLLTYYQTH